MDFVKTPKITSIFSQKYETAKNPKLDPMLSSKIGYYQTKNEEYLKVAISKHLTIQRVNTSKINQMPIY